MNGYVKLLRSEPTLKRLSTIQLIAYFGAWFSNVAIYTLLLNLEVSPYVVAFTAALHFMAGIVQAPFSGPIIDSIKPKKLMLSLTFIEIISTLLLLLVNDVSQLWLLFTLIFIRMSAGSFYFTTEMSLLPKILAGSKLQKANEIHSIIWSLSYTFGMAVSGFVVYALGIKIAFLLDASLFVICFYLLYGLNIDITLEKSKEKLLEMMKESIRYLKKYPHAFHLMLLHSFVGLTAFDALVALMVDRYYSMMISTALGIGLLHASRAIGLVIGPMLFGKWINKQRLVYVFIAQALAIWLWAYMMSNFYLEFTTTVLGCGFIVGAIYYMWILKTQNIKDISDA
jgi:MFS family permease